MTEYSDVDTERGLVQPMKRDQQDNENSNASAKSAASDEVNAIPSFKDAVDYSKGIRVSQNLKKNHKEVEMTQQPHQVAKTSFKSNNQVTPAKESFLVEELPEAFIEPNKKVHEVPIKDVNCKEEATPADENNEANNAQNKKDDDEKSQPEGPPKEKMLPFGKLFQFQPIGDKMIVAGGFIMAIGGGAIAPVMSKVFGGLIDIFDPTKTAKEVSHAYYQLFWSILWISIVLWVSGYFQYAFMQHMAEKLSFDLRSRYLRALMKQETAFFEKQQVEALPSQISEYFSAISEGIGEKIGQAIYTGAMGVGGVILAFIYSWYFTLICLAYMPIIFFIFGVFGKKLKESQILKMKATKDLGGHTEETLGALKLVVSFNREELAIKEFDNMADETRELSKKSSLWMASMMGLFFTFMFGFFCYGYFIGSILVQKKIKDPQTGKPFDINTIVTVSQATLMAMMTLAGLMPILPGISKALMCAQKVFDTIERDPLIKNSESGVVKLGALKEGIEFKDIKFRYPTQPEKTRDVFEKMNFKIKAGTSTAIVGPSGSGKSTIVQMCNRIYDPTGGDILYDGVNLKSLCLKNLRESIGYVGQEPVLIYGTIEENLRYGNKDATTKDMNEALRLANAYDFVDQLQNKLETFVGVGSILTLSGGQKQRIAIARALIKMPKILILDEATSALDPKSEAEVQEAIKQIQEEKGESMTIIMIAHRLQTIITAQNLIYLQDPNSALTATKGTHEYDQIIEKLEKTNYAHQQENNNAIIKNEEEVDAKDGALRKLLTSRSRTNTNSTQKQEEKHNVQKNENATVRVNKESDDAKYGKGWRRIWCYFNPKILSFLMPLLALCSSTAWPVLGLVISKVQFVIIAMIHNPTDENTKLRNDWFIGFVCLCVAIGFIYFLEKLIFGISGENLTCQVRKVLFKGIIFKQVCWFDDEEKAPGVLTTRLSEDVALLNGMTTETLSTVMEAFLSMAFGVALACYFCWQQSLVTLATVPILIIGVIAMAKLQWNKTTWNKNDAEGDPYLKSNALLSDVILNYKTVISFGEKNIDSVIKKYEELLTEPAEKRIRQAHVAGFFFGYSQAARMVFVGLVFYLGTVISKKYHVPTDKVFISIWILFSCAMGAGSSMSNIPSVNKAKDAAGKIFEITDEISSLDVRDVSPDQVKKVVSGKIEFKDVNFKYPSRDTMVLDKFNCEIPATFKIALVGHSGCGKSTITNLLLRFYHTMSGEILIDGIPIQDYDVNELRQQIGFVQQEPILFNRTIKENILYGQLDADNAKIRKVCEMANALTFIESNLEDLDADQKIVRIHESLKAQIDQLCKEYPNFSKATDGLLKRSNDIQELLLQVFTKSDKIALDLIGNDPISFVKQLDQNEASLGKGMRWDELVLRIEWNCEIEKLLQRTDITKQQFNLIKSVSESMQFCFNSNSIQRWLAGNPGTSSDSNLVNFINQDFQNFYADRYERLEQLLNSMVEKKRDANGQVILGEGFNKNCGLKGSKLSGGQKQRIAIARALIKDPKILILDEATSALDEQSQEIVQQALDRAMEGRTAIVIAHRLSTIRNCQLLFVIHEGRIVEQGTYDELSANKASYFFKLKSGMEM